MQSATNECKYGEVDGVKDTRALAYKVVAQVQPFIFVIGCMVFVCF
jgi:hypothetical protein